MQQKLQDITSALQQGLLNSSYASTDWFEHECRTLLAGQFFLAGHSSEFTTDGQFKRLHWCGEDLLLVRVKATQWQVMSNSCLHRGATLISAEHGVLDTMRCRYHGWQYNNEGLLLSTREQAPCLHRQVKLRQYTVKVVAGLLLISLQPQEQAADAAVQKLQPYFDSYRLGSLAVRTSEYYVCKANWKLVTENFLECYHCYLNHPELTAIEGHVQLLEAGDIHGFIQKQALYARTALRLGYLLPPPQGLDPVDDIFSVINAVHLASPRLTGSESGDLLGPSLTGLQAVGGFLFGSLGPFIHFSIYADHVVLFSFIPCETDKTMIQLSWLSPALLTEQQQQEMKYLWHQTIQQDIVLCELVQQQMKSQFSQRSYYTAQESESAAFYHWYRRSMQSWPNADQLKSETEPLL
jgi:Rieske 2Fe-2S family protein